MDQREIDERSEDAGRVAAALVTLIVLLVLGALTGCARPFAPVVQRSAPLPAEYMTTVICPPRTHLMVAYRDEPTQGIAVYCAPDLPPAALPRSP